jgi:hypothetical protein
MPDTRGVEANVFDSATKRFCVLVNTSDGQATAFGQFMAISIARDSAALPPLAPDGVNARREFWEDRVNESAGVRKPARPIEEIVTDDFLAHFDTPGRAKAYARDKNFLEFIAKFAEALTCLEYFELWSLDTTEEAAADEEDAKAGRPTMAKSAEERMFSPKRGLPSVGRVENAERRAAARLASDRALAAAHARQDAAAERVHLAEVRSAQLRSATAEATLSEQRARGHSADRSPDGGGVYDVEDAKALRNPTKSSAANQWDLAFLSRANYFDALTKPTTDLKAEFARLVARLEGDTKAALHYQDIFALTAARGILEVDVTDSRAALRMKDALIVELVSEIIARATAIEAKEHASAIASANVRALSHEMAVDDACNASALPVPKIHLALVNRPHQMPSVKTDIANIPLYLKMPHGAQARTSKASLPRCSVAATYVDASASASSASSGELCEDGRLTKDAASGAGSRRPMRSPFLG